MVIAGLGTLSFVFGKIFSAKPAPSADTDRDAEGGVDDTAESTATESADNKNPAAAFSLSSLLGLISAICGIVSLFSDSSSLYLFRTYQAFITLSLIELIPVSTRTSPPDMQYTVYCIRNAA